MLNELYNLSSALESKNISVNEWHMQYKVLPNVTSKAPCLRIWLNSDGSVYDVESIGAELTQSLRKFGNNQGTFPAFNIVPLFRITDENKIEELEKIENKTAEFDLVKIKSWCVKNNWKDSITKKINRSLHDTSQNFLDIIGNHEQNEFMLISELIRVVSGYSEKSENSFRSYLIKCVFQKLEKQEDINTMLSILFDKKDNKKNKNNDKYRSISIFLDLYDWHKYGYPVANKHMTEWINEKLIISSLHNYIKPEKGQGIDAFGMPFINPDNIMPSVKLSGFEVTLRSMFKGQPCQYRYNRIEDKSYPISSENRSNIKKSFEWISDSEREDLTWRKIDKAEIIFAYPSKLSEIPVKYVSVFGTTQKNNSAQNEARFENTAKEFIKSLKGIPTRDKPEYIRIFSVRKLDKARSKVMFSHNCSPDRFIESAERWESGCRNLPGNDFGEIIKPFPLQVAQIVNNVWKKNGELAQGQTAVERMKYYQGIELLLDIMQKSMISNYLHILLINSTGLVNYIGNWLHGGSKNDSRITARITDELKEETLMLISLFGLLLYKNDDRKEKYMENTAYLLGQILKISDELHTLYCKAVRSGDIPPQLAGSALFVSAGETPYQAITQLSLRINPYITWAKQYRYKNIKEEGKESWKAAWFLKLFEETADKLSSAMTESTRFNDFEKSQLFIGYLASFPKSENT